MSPTAAAHAGHSDVRVYSSDRKRRSLVDRVVDRALKPLDRLRVDELRMGGQRVRQLVRRCGDLLTLRPRLGSRLEVVDPGAFEAEQFRYPGRDTVLELAGHAPAVEARLRHGEGAYPDPG